MSGGATSASRISASTFGNPCGRTECRAVPQTVETAAGEAGALYLKGARLSTPDQTAVSQYYKAGDWNELAISAHGRRIVVHVNGIKTADLDNGPGPARGYLALRSSEGAGVWFNELEILRPCNGRSTSTNCGTTR